jgi:hypothetical protein
MTIHAIPTELVLLSCFAAGAVVLFLVVAVLAIQMQSANVQRSDVQWSR